jgi:predicted O-methyltransferase YrrM
MTAKLPVRFRSPLRTRRVERKLLKWTSGKLNHASRKIDAFLCFEELRDSGVGHVQMVRSYTMGRELRALYSLAVSCSKGAFALEIGSHLGASTCYLATGLSHVGGHLFCVDTWRNDAMPDGSEDTFAAFVNNTLPLRAWITAIRKRSCELTCQDIRTPLQLVFIDGDHNYDVVKRDFEMIQTWISGDAVVAFHDFGNPEFEGVSRVVGEGLGSGQWMIAGLESSLVWLRRSGPHGAVS